MVSALAFWVFALVAIASSVVMITRKKPVQSAIAFLVTLLSLAGLYLLLHAQFVAILQIVIYAGAILVLFLFVIMLLHSHSGEGSTRKIQYQRPVAIGLFIVLLGSLVYVYAGAGLGAPEIPVDSMGTAESVGNTLFGQFILPFEIASVILLAGLIGAVVIAKRPRVEEEESSS